MSELASAGECCVECDRSAELNIQLDYGRTTLDPVSEVIPRGRLLGIRQGGMGGMWSGEESADTVVNEGGCSRGEDVQGGRMFKGGV